MLSLSNIIQLSIHLYPFIATINYPTIIYIQLPFIQLSNYPTE